MTLAVVISHEKFNPSSTYLVDLICLITSKPALMLLHDKDGSSV